RNGIRQSPFSFRRSIFALRSVLGFRSNVSNSSDHLDGYRLHHCARLQTKGNVGYDNSKPDLQRSGRRRILDLYAWMGRLQDRTEATPMGSASRLWWLIRRCGRRRHCPAIQVSLSTSCVSPGRFYKVKKNTTATAGTFLASQPTCLSRMCFDLPR